MSYGMMQESVWHDPFNKNNYTNHVQNFNQIYSNLFTILIKELFWRMHLYTIYANYDIKSKIFQFIFLLIDAKIDCDICMLHLQDAICKMAFSGTNGTAYLEKRTHRKNIVADWRENAELIRVPSIEAILFVISVKWNFLLAFFFFFLSSFNEFR